MKTIIVNDVAASSGGALSILRQFLAELKNNEVAKSYRWIVFVSNDLVNEYNDVHIEIVKVDAKKWRKRIWWDTFGICKWLHNRHIEPSLAVSMMSVGFLFLRARQVVYFHQSLPVSGYRSYKWFEFKLRLYVIAIGRWMKFSFRRGATVVIQNSALRDSISEFFSVDKNSIYTFRPGIEKDSFEVTERQDGYSYRMIYPAIASGSYKNHEIIIRSLKDLSQLNMDLFMKLKVIFTCGEDDNMLTRSLVRLSRRLNVHDRVEWSGYLDKKELNRLYNECDFIVFPSLVESYTVPLVEAAHLGKWILAFDKGYARFELEGYEQVRFFDTSAKLAEEIVNFYRMSHYCAERTQKWSSGSEWNNFVRTISDLAKRNS